MSFLTRNNIEALLHAAGITKEDMMQASRDPKYANQVARRLVKQGEEVAKEVANAAIGQVAQQVRDFFLSDPSVAPNQGWSDDRPSDNEDLGDALRESIDRMFAYDTLGLDFDPGEIAPLHIAESIYKSKAQQKHPDKGGTTEEMQDLNRAIEYIREEHRRKQ